MKSTVFYCVAGHRFGVTADEGCLKVMDNYESFTDDGSGSLNSEKFMLEIADGPAPSFVEDFRQVDGEQEITCGRTADGSRVFGFRWLGETAGCLVCTDDYRRGRLVVTGRFTRLAIDNALMIMYALATAADDTVLFHASAVSLNDRGYIFLGPSGTGKSTHARLWLRHIPGTVLINDDNPVVRFATDGVATVYGSPWSGKTACYRNVSYPLGAIVKLSQAPFNKIAPLDGIQAYAAIMASISGTRWDRRVADGLHSSETRLVASVPVRDLECLPDREAVQICHSAITDPTWRPLTNN